MLLKVDNFVPRLNLGTVFENNMKVWSFQEGKVVSVLSKTISTSSLLVNKTVLKKKNENHEQRNFSSSNDENLKANKSVYMPCNAIAMAFKKGLWKTINSL